MDNIVGNRLKKLRTEQQLTMEMMVEDFNMKFGENLNTSQVSRWENGKTDPGLSTGAKLAMYYNVSLDYLIGLTDVKTPSRLLALATRQKTAEVDDSLTRFSLSERASLTTRPQMAARPGIAPRASVRRPEIKLNHKTTNDDDFEYDFLNMDDDDKKGRK